MIYAYSDEMQQQLNKSLALLNIIFGSDLLGVYLYGSALVGGLQKYSDIDLFVVASRVMTLEEKITLVHGLLSISGIYMKSSTRPLEVTMVEKSMVNPWHYPPRFDFQYGEWLRESFEKGIVEPWSTDEMPDLAVIITQVLLKNKTLCGSTAEQLLAPVPYKDFIRAMTDDLDRLAADLENDTRNVLLTYARIWSTVTTDEIRSKPAAADWALLHLPRMYQSVMQRAKSICIGIDHEHWDDIKSLIAPCAAFMADEIKERIALINLDDSIKVIKLAEDQIIS